MGAKIVVVHLRQLLKTAVLALIGIALIGFLIYLFIPNGEDETALYVPGTYGSEIILHNNPVEVSVTVSENEITDIQLLNMGETQAVFYPLFEPAMEQLSAEIIENQSLDIELSADSSMTNEILLKAVEKALEKAKNN